MPSPHPVDRLYRRMMGDRVLGALIVLLAVAVVLGLFLPQAPATLADPDAMGRWLAETSNRYGSLGSILQSAGLFDLWHSLWFRALVAGLAFILLLRFGFALGDAIKRLHRPDPLAAVAEARRWPLHATIELHQALASTSAELVDDLRSEGWRVTSVDSDSNATIVAERSRWGLAAIPVFYAGLLLVLAGLWLGQLLGWREGNLALLPGRPVLLQHNSQMSISLVDEGTGGDTVVVQSSDGTLATGALSDAGRTRLAGLTIHRTSQGQSLAVSAQDQDGTPLQLQSSDQPSRAQTSLNLVFDQPRAEQVFFVPGRELVVSVVAFPALPERGFTGPTFLVQAFQPGQREPVFNQFVEGDAELTVGDDRFQLHSGRLISVEVSRNPAAPLVAAGLGLVLFGLIVALWRPAGRLALSVRQPASSPAHGGKKGGSTHVSVDVGLQPAPLWREANRWLLAWTSAYDTREQS